MLSATSMKNEKLKISAMKYFVRSLKYFCALCVLCIVLMGLMLMTGTSALSLDDTLYAMFHTDRYLMLFTAIVVLAALYPDSGSSNARSRATWRRTANRSSTHSARRDSRSAARRTG